MMGNATPGEAREKLWGPERPAQEYEYIVIGAGMGGLVAAATLAKAGRRVLVVEQHYGPGGYVQSFRRKHWSWDVGLHMVGEVTADREFGRLLRYLTDGRIAWTPIGNPYDRYEWPDGFVFEYQGNAQGYTGALVAAFPDQRAAIERWTELCQRSYSALLPYLKAKILPVALERIAQAIVGRKLRRDVLQRRTCDVLDELTDDPRLKAVLAGQWFYWGTPPSQASFAINAVAVAHFLTGGGYYPVGGADAVVTELARTIVSAGGWIQINADAQEIVVEDDRAVGVLVRSHRDQAAHHVTADRVVSAAGVYATVHRLLPARYRTAPWVAPIAALKPNMAYITLFLGFEGDIRNAGASAMNRGYWDTWDTEATWQIGGPDAVGRVPFMWVCFNSLKDAAHQPGPKQRYAGEVMCFAPWDVFERWQATRWQHRPDGYDQLKDALGKALLAQFLEHMPQLAPYIVHSELSTPLSADHFVRAPEGSAYGLHHSVERFMTSELRPRTPIRDLYFAGNELVILGVMGAAMGGFLSAVAAEPMRSLKILHAIM
jgi:all-trans-retinol 13,14-reductase